MDKQKIHLPVLWASATLIVSNPSREVEVEEDVPGYTSDLDMLSINLLQQQVYINIYYTYTL